MDSSPFSTHHRSGSPLIGAVSLLLISIMLVLSIAPAVSARQTTPADDVTSGVLVLKTRTGATPAAVQLGTDMDVTITGQTARVKVVQAFRNTGRDWAEATYLYPLPEDGAVDSLKMVIGQRVIIGRINRREAARQIYEQAKAEGRGAGLVEQQRPNMFTNRVANIGPGETVLIEIEYQAPVRRVSGEYSFRLPLVVGPRYVPATASGVSDVATARAVGAPVRDPRHQALTNPVSITVHLNPGFAPTGVVSSYHPVRITNGPGSERTVSLTQATVPADRDFELRWRSSETDPTVSLFREHLRNQDYLMAVIEPPAAVHRRTGPSPRELIFVIDNSGSMSGDSMVQARESLKLALRSLTPADRFNVIRFDDSLTKLFDQPVSATSDQVNLALRFASQLEAQGGTEMLPALRAALVDDAPSDHRVRQVIFLTDGSISNEDDMLRVLGSDRGRSRVFMVGIGSAPNSFLMSRMAEVGRGTYTHIGDTREVIARMSSLLDRLTRPVITDLRVYGQGGDAEFTPVDLPDLYEGEPLVVLGRSGARMGRMTVSGMLDGRPWTRRIDLSQAVEGQGIGKLWGKRRITDIEVASRLGQMTDEVAAQAIGQLGLDFSIVTRETSLVAVDTTPRRPEGARLTEEELPLNLPRGWDFDALFGGPVASAGMDGNAEAADPLEPFGLPQTATAWEQTLWSGLGLMMIAGLGLVIIRRRRMV